MPLLRVNVDHRLIGAGNPGFRMLWDSDIYIGAIVGLLKSKAMYDNSVIVYTADNGGTGQGLK